MHISYIILLVGRQRLHQKTPEIFLLAERLQVHLDTVVGGPWNLRAIVASIFYKHAANR